MKVESELSKLQNINNLSLLQDYLWKVCLSFHHYSIEERASLLSEFKRIISQKNKQILFWILIYLRSAYFSVMDEKQKIQYLELLEKLGKDQHGYLLAETFELTGTLYRIAPDISRPSIIDMMIDNSAGADYYSLLAFCNAIERIAPELSNKDKQKFLQKLNILRSNSTQGHLNTAIDSALRWFEQC
jgi:hypothetical protein